MTSTTNKGLDLPALNDPNWNVPLNGNFGIIDAALGGVTSINVTGVGTSPVTLTDVQYQNLIIKFSGTLTANVNYRVPSGVGGQWVVQNATTGAFTVTMSSGGGGTSAVVSAGFSNIASDGTNIATVSGAIADGSITYAKLQNSSAGYVVIGRNDAAGGVYGEVPFNILGGATGGGSDRVFYENGQTVTTNYTITNGTNAMSAGPITINSGVTVTVGTGEVWTVV
jgi:hypothetical protein